MAVLIMDRSLALATLMVLDASLFSGLEKENLRYSIICEEFDKRGIEIFNKEIQDKCNKYDPAEYALKNDEEY